MNARGINVNSQSETGYSEKHPYMNLLRRTACLLKTRAVTGIIMEDGGAEKAGF